MQNWMGVLANKTFGLRAQIPGAEQWPKKGSMRDSERASCPVKAYRSGVPTQWLLDAPRGNSSSSIPSPSIFFDLPLMCYDAFVFGACMKRILHVNVWIQEEWRFDSLVRMKSESEESILWFLESSRLKQNEECDED